MRVVGGDAADCNGEREERGKGEELIGELGYSWLNNCYTGVLKHANLLTVVGDKLAEENIGNCLLRPIGGNLVLLSATGGASMAEVLHENSLWFESLGPGPRRILLLDALLGSDVRVSHFTLGPTISSRGWQAYGAP
ncbi:hypothetical protein Ancab_025867 [Ancistrocladus abbreviatus]